MIFFLMTRPPTRSTRPDTPVPYTALFRSRPMKGTARRGADPARDATAAAALLEDPKQRAENLMIVDLLRNDLARVSRPGSVKVPSLFAVETYRSEEHTSELQSLMRISYAVFCLKKKNNKHNTKVQKN